MGRVMEKNGVLGDGGASERIPRISYDFLFSNVIFISILLREKASIAIPSRVDSLPWCHDVLSLAMPSYNSEHAEEYSRWFNCVERCVCFPNAHH